MGRGNDVPWIAQHSSNNNNKNNTNNNNNNSNSVAVSMIGYSDLDTATYNRF